MKLMTVKQYAEYTGLSIPAIYKQVRENRVKAASMFGKILIKVTEKEKV